MPLLECRLRMKMKKASQKAKIGEGCTIERELLSSLPKDSKVVWSKGNDSISYTNLNNSEVWGSKYSGSTMSYPSLTILNVDKSDEGYYSCRIEYPEDSAEYDDTDLEWPITHLHVASACKLFI